MNATDTTQLINDRLTQYVRQKKDQDYTQKATVIYHKYFNNCQLVDSGYNHLRYIPLTPAQVNILSRMTAQNIDQEQSLAQLQELAVQLLNYPREQTKYCIFGPSSALLAIARQQIQNPNPQQAEYLKKLGLTDLFRADRAVICAISNPPLSEDENQLNEVVNYFKPPFYDLAAKMIQDLEFYAFYDGKHPEGLKRFIIPLSKARPWQEAIHQHPQLIQTLDRIAIVRQGFGVKRLVEICTQSIDALRETRPRCDFLVTLEGAAAPSRASQILTPYFTEALNTYGSEMRKSLYRGAQLEYDPTFQIFHLHCANGETYYRPLTPQDIQLLSHLPPKVEDVNQNQITYLKDLAFRMVTHPVKTMSPLPMWDGSMRKLERLKEHFQQIAQQKRQNPQIVLTGPAEEQWSFMQRIGYLDMFFIDKNTVVIFGDKEGSEMYDFTFSGEIVSLPYERDETLKSFAEQALIWIQSQPKNDSLNFNSSSFQRMKQNWSEVTVQPEFKKVVQDFIDISEAPAILAKTLYALMGGLTK